VKEMDIEKRKIALKYFFQKTIGPLGYKFSPDKELVDFLLEQEVILEQKHGIPYCPCQGLTEKRDENMKIVCPCIPFHRKHFDMMKRCWCGLYVHKDVTNPAELKQISINEIESD
jgi:ferredoxin-thioredoxin reductase catalytic subunit